MQLTMLIFRSSALLRRGQDFRQDRPRPAYRLTHLLVAMPISDLVDSGLAGVEHHQLGWLSAHRPTGVIGVSDWRMADPARASR